MNWENKLNLKQIVACTMSESTSKTPFTLRHVFISGVTVNIFLNVVFI